MASAGANTSLHGDQAVMTAFVSYSRVDCAVADRIVEALEAWNINVLIDRRDLPLFEDWQQELLDLIRRADCVVFLISPHSASSAVCAWEVEQAVIHEKRLAPVIVGEVSRVPLADDLKRVNYVDLRNASEFERKIEQLAQALTKDHAWLKEHTRFSQLARRWLERDQYADGLLRGTQLEEMIAWSARRPPGAPRLSADHEEFLDASRRDEVERLKRETAQIARTRRLQRHAAWALAGIALLTAAGIIAGFVQSRLTAETEARVFSSLAQRAFDTGNCPLAIRFAVSALPPEGALPTTVRSQELEGQLIRAVSTCPLLSSTASDGDAGRVLPGAMTGILNSRTDRSHGLWTLQPPMRFATLEGKANWFGPAPIVTHDGSRLIQLDEDNALRVYSLRDGKVLRTLRPVWGTEPVTPTNDLSLAVSGDSKTIALGAPHRRIRVFSLDSDETPREFGFDDAQPLALNRDGTRLLLTTTTYPRRAELWDLSKDIRLFEWSPDGLLTGGGFSPEDSLFGLWGLALHFWRLPAAGTPIEQSVVPVDGVIITSIEFDPTWARVVVSDNTETRIVDLKQKTTLKLAQPVSDVRFLPDGQYFVAGGVHERNGQREMVLGVWESSSGEAVATIPISGGINGIAVSSDGMRVAIGTGALAMDDRVTGDRTSGRSSLQLWDLKWLGVRQDADALRRLVCAEKYVGANPFTQAELADPVLQGDRQTIAPCERRGPLSIDYWRRLVAAAVAMDNQ